METFLEAFLEKYEFELPKEEFTVLVEAASECHRNEMVGFAEWLEYNGKYESPESQVDSYLTRESE